VEKVPKDNGTAEYCTRMSKRVPGEGKGPWYAGEKPNKEEKVSFKEKLEMPTM